MRKMDKFISSAVLCVILTIIFSFNTFALETENLSEGTYSVDATLSCYVNAMGGIEFGAPLLTGSTIKVDANGSQFKKRRGTLCYFNFISDWECKKYIRVYRLCKQQCNGCSVWYRRK